MTHKYDDWNDRSIRSAFPAVDVKFDEKGDSEDSLVQLEITDVRGEIIEIKLKDNHYLHLSLNDLNRCASNFKTDFGRK